MSSIPRQIVGFVASVILGAAITIPTDLTLYAYVSFGINWFVSLVHAIPFKSERFFDLTGSITFITVSIVATIVTLPLHSDGVSFWRSLAASLMVILWAIRLGSFLFSRIQADGGVDTRFVEIRVLPLRFFSIFSVQGLWVLISSLPVLLLLTSKTQSNDISISDIVGVLIYIVGLTIEVTADAQKTSFRKIPSNKGTYITSGLWKYSRHPNYFGEISVWTGVTVLCAPQLSSIYLQLLASITPVFVFMLLNFVSGVPQLEAKADEKWGHLESYQQYKVATNALVPWFPKSVGLATASSTYGATSSN